MICVICGFVCSHKEGLEAPVKTVVDKFQLLPAFLKVRVLSLMTFFRNGRSLTVEWNPCLVALEEGDQSFSGECYT